MLACFPVPHPEIIKPQREKADLTYSARSIVPDWLTLLLFGKVALRAETTTGHFRTDLAVFEGMPSDLKNRQKSHKLRFSLVFTPSSAFLETKPQKQGPGVRG